MFNPTSKAGYFMDKKQLQALAIANRLKNDYSQCPDMWQKNTANCHQNNVALL
ncbi:hypothetical protein [Symbiopectobacterium sp. RP]|uniref:hypothetical protein n=1 Tax=Symbiopectobacterium sp. RP TaxID=3248553 RepID=UPI003D28896D